MSALANKHKATNLSQGFPNFPIANNLIELLTKYSTDGYNQYAPMPGVLPLRESIANHISNKYNQDLNPEDEITITAGATQAIFTAITASIKQHDEVIIFTPAYDCYEPAISLNGGKTIHIPLEFPHYTINWSVVRQKITTKTKMIIVNSPHNPTGAVFNSNDINELATIAEKNNLIVISDEVYEHITFDNKKHLSVLNHPQLKKRSFVTFSFGKSLHVTGWKMGYCIAPPFLTKEFRKVHQFNVFSCNTPAQYAISEYMDKHHPFDDIAAMYEQKRNLFLENIKDSRFDLQPTSGTYFQLLSYKNISDEGDVAFAKRLTIDHKIASIPISVFYKNNLDEKVLRFCFAKTDETIIEAAKKLCEI